MILSITIIGILRFVKPMSANVRDSQIFYKSSSLNTVEGMNGCAVEVHGRRGNCQGSVQAQSHRIAGNKDGDNTQRKA